MLALIARREADAAAQEGERALEAAIRDLAGATQAQGEAVKLQAIAAAAMPARREAEVAAAAALTRLRRGLDEIEAEDRRRAARMQELERRLDELSADEARAHQTSEDAAATLARLEAERAALTDETAQSGETLAQARAALQTAEAALAAREKQVSELQAERADLGARADAARRAQGEAESRGPGSRRSGHGWRRTPPPLAPPAPRRAAAWRKPAPRLGQRNRCSPLLMPRRRLPAWLSPKRGMRLTRPVSPWAKPSVLRSASKRKFARFRSFWPSTPAISGRA